MNNNSNFALQSLLMGYGSFSALRQRVTALIKEAAGEMQITIPKTVAQVVDWDVKRVDGGTTTKLFTGTKLAGGSNLPSSYIKNADEHAIYTAIRLQDSDDDATTVSDIDWNNGVTNLMLQNAYITVKSNGYTVLDDIPLSSMLDVAEIANGGTFDLQIPFVWIGQTELEIELTSPTTPAGTNNIWLKASLIGFGTVS